MTLGSKLGPILKAELVAGNEIEGEYINQFAKCKVLFVLKHPFRATYDLLPDGVERFSNHDSHYPVGSGYEDAERQEMLLAPFA